MAATTPRLVHAQSTNNCATHRRRWRCWPGADHLPVSVEPSLCSLLPLRQIFNNYVHDVTGAGMGVWGCYDCLLAHNTLVRVGASSHTLELNFGPRSCDEDAPRCAALHGAGGWGPPAVGGTTVSVPNRNVYILNNLIFNPAGYQSQVGGCRGREREWGRDEQQHSGRWTGR